jgi:hypothetical protein
VRFKDLGGEYICVGPLGVVTLCALVGRHQRFGGTCCFHRQQYVRTAQKNIDMDRRCLRRGF